ncbi:MAG TPA: flagellar filament capping protein FliD [Stellaceae bacterium]|jgi:flagellar hook-associated protein 2
MAVSDALSSSQITSLIQQAQAANQLPAGVLQAQEKPIQAQVTALTQVQGALSQLQTALGGLTSIQTLAQRSVSVSPSGAVTATAANTSQPGTYALTGIHLAAAESLLSSGSASASGSLGAGTLTIQVGNQTAVNVTIASGSSSLADIAQAIDQADAGVQASVVFDGSSYHLVLAGNGTGTANAFTVSGSGSLAGLSYSPVTSGTGMGLTTAAANASFSLDGLTITSGSNTINGVVPGLSLTLAQSGSATVKVTQNATALESAAQNLVSAINNVLGTIAQSATFTQASGGGPLFGNIGVEIIRSDLLTAVSTTTNPNAALGSPYSSLSTIGFTVTSGGSVTFNANTFETAAQTNYGAVASLLGEIGTASNPGVAVEGIGSASAGTYAVNVASNSGGTVVGTINGEAASGTGGIMTVTDSGPARGLSLQIGAGLTGSLGSVSVSEGVFASLSSLVTAALASGSGGVTGQIGTLNATLTSMNTQVNQLLAQAQQETQLLTQQFTQAQATLSQLNTVSSFLTTFFNQSSGGG